MGYFTKKIILAIGAFLVSIFLLSTQAQAQVYFGQVAVNSINYQTTFITNNSSENLTFRNAWVAGNYFNLNHNCYAGLKAGQTCTAQIQFWPMTSGFHTAQATFNFSIQNSYRQISQYIGISGQAYR